MYPLSQRRSTGARLGWVRRYARCSAIGALMAMASVQQARSSDLTLQPKFTESGEVDTNPLLLSSGAKTAIGSITSPEATINDDTPLAHLDLDTRIDFNEYDLPEFSSNDLHTQGHASYKGATSFFGTSAGLDYDTTRTSELTGSGINVAGVRHTGLSFSPQGGFNLSPLDIVSANASYTRAQYSNTLLFTDYDTYSVGPGYQHTFDALNTGTAGLQASRFQTTTGPSITFDTYNPTVGWNRTFTQ